MLPAIFSKKAFKKCNQSWSRSQVNNLVIKRNKLSGQELPEKQGRLFTLSFEFNSLYARDTVYIATNYPYTNRNSNDFFRLLYEMPIHHKMYIYIHIYYIIIIYYVNSHMEQRSIAKTAGNVDVQLITLTSKQTHPNVNKSVIFIIARQHPAETTSSYVLDGIIRGII